MKDKKNKNNDTFPIIPFIHMVYAQVSCNHHTIDIDIHYENHKKVHYKK